MRRLSTRHAFPAVLVALFIASCGGESDRSGPPPNPTPPAPAAGTIGDARLPELLEWARAAQDVPAMGIVIIRNGQIAESAVVGRRSMSSPTLATVTDRWHMGSITKSMTATLAAMLVEDGLITWDTRPSDVWPDLEQDIHAGFRNTTLRQLLSHTSGMKRDDDCSCASNGESGSLMQKRRAWAAHVLRRAPEFSAGSWNYSNIGYVIAGAMLETRAQTPWESLLTNRLFVPLGMMHSGFGAPGTAGAVDEPWGHWSTNSGFDPVSPGPNADNWAALGPAGLVHVTLDDFSRYLLAHLEGARGTPGILSTQSFATLHTTVAADYALGWWNDTQLNPLGAAGLRHGGTNGRWFARAWFSPAEDAGVLMVTNGGGERGDAALGAMDGVIRARIAATP